MIQRTEIIGPVTLILGDSVEVAPTLERHDAICADPPYGYGYRPSRQGSRNSAVRERNFGPEDQLIGDTGNLDFDPRPFLPLADKHIWWGGNCYADKLPNSRSWFTWFKADGNTRMDQGHAELAWTNLDKAIRGINHRWYGMVRDSEQNEKPVHPTQKPIAVMQWCLSYLEKTDTVLDPYMGSGTTLVAAVKMGMTATGIEIDPKFFDIACRRVSEAYEQRDLFL